MRVAVTGTPGTGKTTAVERVEVGHDGGDTDAGDTDAPGTGASDLDVVHLNEVIRERGFDRGRDDERGSLVADLEAVADWLEGRDDLLVESHLAHLFPADRVVVLRCHPEELERRLLDRGEPAGKAEENAGAERYDVILAEAVEEHGPDAVYEIDTTRGSPDAVAAEIERVIAGEREPSAGEVEFLDG